MAGPLDRRTLLQLGGTAAVSSLAGCASVSAELGWRTQELGRVVLANSIDEPAEVDVEVVRNGTTVHESSYRLDPGSPEERPQITLYEWQQNPTAKKWVVRARTATGEWQDGELWASRGGRDDCHSVFVVAGDWPEAETLVVPGGCKTP
ncbi:hypothetical protein [Haloarchaeobius sp. HRN-SO-5]|uniref:hypothetical protein n=1 Tax=Haloarchaeobius sp. HRN-SO-5 TaxID=3446118 RepID=UPI003EBD8D2E